MSKLDEYTKQVERHKRMQEEADAGILFTRSNSEGYIRIEYGRDGTAVNLAPYVREYLNEHIDEVISAALYKHENTVEAARDAAEEEAIQTLRTIRVVEQRKETGK